MAYEVDPFPDLEKELAEAAKELRETLPEGARKFDAGKARWDLLPFRALGLIAQVLTFGAKKYDENNWQGLDIKRVEAAMLRHYAAYRSGELLDPETGLPHLAHFGCCALFMLAIKHGLDPVRP